MCSWSKKMFKISKNTIQPPFLVLFASTIWYQSSTSKCWALKSLQRKKSKWQITNVRSSLREHLSQGHQASLEKTTSIGRTKWRCTLSPPNIESDLSSPMGISLFPDLKLNGQMMILSLWSSTQKPDTLWHVTYQKMSTRFEN